MRQLLPFLWPGLSPFQTRMPQRGKIMERRGLHSWTSKRRQRKRSSINHNFVRRCTQNHPGKWMPVSLALPKPENAGWVNPRSYRTNWIPVAAACLQLQTKNWVTPACKWRRQWPNWAAFDECQFLGAQLHRPELAAFEIQRKSSTASETPTFRWHRPPSSPLRLPPQFDPTTLPQSSKLLWYENMQYMLWCTILLSCCFVSNLTFMKLW